MDYYHFSFDRYNPNVEARQDSLTKQLYERYYATKPHEKARSTTPKNEIKIEEHIESRTFGEKSDRTPKHQEPPKVHPSRYNALPIGILIYFLLIKELVNIDRKLMRFINTIPNCNVNR